MDSRSSDEDLAATLKAIEESYAARLPERFAAMQADLDLCRADSANRVAWESLQRHLHALSGSAGTFGFTALGLRATEMEILLNQFLAQSMPAEGVSALMDGVQNMLVWAAAPARHDDGAQLPLPLQQGAAAATAAASHLIHLVHDDAETARDIAVQLENFGYHVKIIPELAQMEAAIAEQVPAAVIMDLGFPAGIMAGAVEVARLRQNAGRDFRVIFISTRSNFEARLATVRAGADGYFSKPLDVVALIDRLDSLVVQEEAQPCRVLIVDDDVRVSEYYALVLRRAGMEVRVLNYAPEVLQAMGEFRPELILMDLYMPVCDGFELARLIRQDNLYFDLPIVFLSSESDFDKQLHAIESGGDHFLAKPIKPAYLAATVASRARRYRELRSLIMRDSLTGLLNHSAVKEALAREIARARRTGTPLSLAMIDIDFFKQINDGHGHPVGDQVIRALSRLLQQRLRRGDIIGRYGGEEFAVIMPGTPATGASGALDTIRESFARVRHYAETHEFNSSFSAGIAELDGDADADALLRMADEALYQAKRDGRNRIRAA